MSMNFFQIKEQEPEPDKVDKANEKIKEFFLKLAGADQEVDWMELKDILDYAMRNGKLKMYKQEYIVFKI